MGIALAMRICIIVIGTLPKIMRFGRVRRVGDVPNIAYFFYKRKELEMRIYYGMDVESNRTIFATVTGQMIDGTLVYTEVEQNEDGSIVTKDGEPELILDNQYTRHLRHGMQTFSRI